MRGSGLMALSIPRQSLRVSSLSPDSSVKDVAAMDPAVTFTEAAVGTRVQSEFLRSASATGKPGSPCTSPAPRQTLADGLSDHRLLLNEIDSVLGAWHMVGTPGLYRILWRTSQVPTLADD